VILVLSHGDDEHALTVLRELDDRGAETHLINLAELPARAGVSIQFDGGSPSLTFHAGASEIDLNSVTATWWRRPQAANPSAVGDPNGRWFAVNEWAEILGGLWALLPGRWMNEPAADERASHKPFQLRVAGEVGFTVPRTLMTSDPDRARAFVDSLEPGRTIFKMFAATPTVWRETRLVRPQELEILDAVRVAPVIFQEHIPADADIRVTVVGELVFALAIDARSTAYPLDFRMSLGEAKTGPADLPRAVIKKVRALMVTLGLAYGAIDLRRTPDGDYVFLEINPAGEFLFAQDRTGQPIARALADWLAGADGNGGERS
jgi:hypothetical protein